METQITLADKVNGIGEETGRHIAFDTIHPHEIAFTDGVGILYYDPDFAIETVVLDGVTYSVAPTGAEKGMTVTSRFNYATIEQVQNLSVNSEVKVRFTEASGIASSPDRVVTAEKNQNVTVKADNSGGYSMAYSMESDTNTHAVVAQFALYAGQTIHIEDLAGGTVYYVYEYAAGEGDENGQTELIDDWTTEIAITPQGANHGTDNIDDDYEQVISEADSDAEIRAARGLIRTNATQW